MAEAKQKFNYSLLRRVLQLSFPYKKLFYWTIFLAIIQAPIGILRPHLINVMVDENIMKNTLSGLGRLVMWYMLVLVGSVWLRYIFILATNQLGQSIVRDLRTRVFNHIIDLKLAFFDKTPIGTSTTRTINDIESINEVFSEGVITILADILGLIAVLIIMFVVSWKLSLVCLTTLPFLIYASYLFKEKVRISFQQVRSHIARMNSFLQERISGMRIIQIFNSEEQEKSKFKKINKDYTTANINGIFYYAVFFPVVELISATSLALMVWWGANGVIQGEVTLGALVAFPIYLTMLFRPIRFMADKFNTLQMGLVAAERVFGILDNTERIDNKGTVVGKKLNGDIEFDAVRFGYIENQEVLKGISFKVPGHTTLAIVGSTGSGKTTIISVLDRLYDIQQGTIKIDGKNIQDYELSYLRSRIGVVLQDVFLFGGTVLENITFRQGDIPAAEVINAAKQIGAHEFIEKLPGGYDFIISERGSNLSMGQRQLISFVRALVFNPDILILDEATSSIDPESESVIQYAIEKLIEKRTSIIIAHRLSTIRHANQVMVMDHGEIKEIGTHEELLDHPSGFYRKLYEYQFSRMAEVD
ncbi:MAG: ABC transporter ATP-binding protein [Saprospiraceae bacterium]|jgi:ATP-binding cassette subfamily B protein|nr:ABC transporter ATP-binding protein [Saprospiraceae bacterium]MBK6480277.1 ABC transporter ATP-binding protein [Saprospiraceae bacterium]MBK8281948.1 ABC transporter ATP-binding protein [Saprospiraceae bacterium]MBK9929897.1 ABC transporter ATP-binding protein [Saprospiraceae bacterium]MBP7923095.1 ABC transporter ATP-binding protein [Saprospiraceae bacterium]